MPSQDLYSLETAYYESVNCVSTYSSFWVGIVAANGSKTALSLAITVVMIFAVAA